MNDALVQKLKKEVIEAGKLLWDKGLVTGFNGNISVRVDTEIILITGRGTCLGRLHDGDFALMDLDGNNLDGGQASSERALHSEIYKNFRETNAVLHTHTVYTNGYFAVNERLTPSTFEAKFYLGEIKALVQTTPAVTDLKPVIENFKSNSIVVLKNHGVVAMGKNLFDAFVLIQSLEEAVKIDAVSRIYKSGATVMESGAPTDKSAGAPRVASAKKFKLFSQEQIDEIVRVVNTDVQLKEMGQKTQMTMDLAVKLNETGQVYSFHFQNGSITKVGNDENAEFLISAPTNIWKAVFNREIDPFVATTQKKMDLRGDFARISKWYAPCSRIFELWQQVPVE